MRKVIAAINMSLDGYCDHTITIADDELHQHYSDLLSSAGIIIYGRKTYQLMEYWKSVLKDPTGNKVTDEFAVIIDNIPKIVFSHTLKHLDWDTASLAKDGLEEELLELTQQEGKDILVGSPGLITSLTQVGLIDEYQICIHPVLAGNGLTLFKNLKESMFLTLLKCKTFASGAVVLYYATESWRQ